MEAIIALSRGGKGRLAASSRRVFEGKLAVGPALPPTADAIGVKVESDGGLGIGKRGMLVQKQDQMGSLPKVRRRRASPHEASGLAEELVGKNRAIAWRWARHVAAPLNEQSL
jgi:hypothetical protein